MITKITEGLFVGAQHDYENMDPKGWYIIHACKEPYHRELLGYKTASAPKDSKEYLWARRDDVLYMNLVDPREARWIPQTLIDKSLSFIQEAMDKGKPTLVHCNLGNSRAPSICLMYMIRNNQYSSLKEAVDTFKKIYKYYRPSEGFKEFIKKFYEEEEDNRRPRMDLSRVR
jgi:protein-tyrosine phosphatase